MSSVKSFVVLILVNCALFTGAKKACEIEDSECTTKAARDAHKLVIEGVPNQVKSSDPLLRDLINGDLPDLKYKLKNAKMAGMKDCNVELVKVKPKETSFDYNLSCPKIIFDGDYEVNGKLGGLAIEGNGKCKVSCNNYHIFIHGKFDQSKGKDGMTYTQVKQFDVTVESKGKINYEIENLFNGDKEKSAAIEKYVSENPKAVDEAIRDPAINSFIAEYIDHINGYMKLVPVEAMFAL